MRPPRVRGVAAAERVRHVPRRMRVVLVPRGVLLDSEAGHCRAVQLVVFEVALIFIVSMNPERDTAPKVKGLVSCKLIVVVARAELSVAGRVNAFACCNGDDGCLKENEVLLRPAFDL